MPPAVGRRELKDAVVHETYSPTLPENCCAKLYEYPTKFGGPTAAEYSGLFARDANVVVLTVVAVMCFLLIVSLCGKNDIPKAIFHVLGVQAPLFAALVLAERRARYVSVW